MTRSAVRLAFFPKFPVSEAHRQPGRMPAKTRRRDPNGPATH
jgi:hypothetical protein